MLYHGKDIKPASKNKWTEHEYHVQDRKDVSHTSVKISCAKTQFIALSFCGPQAKPHGVRGLSKNYHLRLDPKLGHGKCAIQRIPWACISLTTMLDKPWAYDVDTTKNPRYQPVFGCMYCPVLGSFDNCNIIQFSNKTTESEYFDVVHKVVIDGISDNITSLVQLGKYGSIIAADTTTMS